MGNVLVAHPSFCFFIACTEVNAYMEMQYLLNTDDNFMIFRKKLAKALINNSYTNDRTCVSPENTRKRQLSHILETAPTHDTKYNKKGFAQKNIYTNNTSDVGKI